MLTSFAAAWQRAASPAAAILALALSAVCG
jgi:hypothetical protein